MRWHPQSGQVVVTAPELTRRVGPSPRLRGRLAEAAGVTSPQGDGAAPVVAASTARRSGPPPEPTPVEMAGNFAAAVSRWVAAGAPVVSSEVYAARAAACERCELWDGAARLGLGKCRAPGCGCTSLKRWLATERCKHPDGSRWSA